MSRALITFLKNKEVTVFDLKRQFHLNRLHDGCCSVEPPRLLLQRCLSVPLSHHKHCFFKKKKSTATSRSDFQQSACLSSAPISILRKQCLGLVFTMSFYFSWWTFFICPCAAGKFSSSLLHPKTKLFQHFTSPEKFQYTG